MNAKRGFVPDDERNFSAEAISILRKASRHIVYLINEGYDLKQAVTFAGNHFLLSERQRLAIARSVAAEAQIAGRISRRRQLSDLSGAEVWIDGFNTVITLEVMMSGSPLFYCMDGTIRDLAALHGTYRIIPETAASVRMLFNILQLYEVDQVHILLDAPVSNSGRLKVLIADLGVGTPFSLDIQVRKDVDQELYGKENVVTSDSVILDHCASWVNLTGECMRQRNVEGLRVWKHLP